MNFSIMKCKKAMCPELAKVKFETWKTTYHYIYDESKFLNFDFSLQEQRFKKLINSKDYELLVAIHNDRIIGYMCVGKSPHRPNGKSEIYLLYVLKEFQGLGVGRAFFNLGKEIIKNKGETQFYVFCNKYNKPAQKFYEKMGGIVTQIDEDNIDKSIPQIGYLFHI